MRVCNQGYSSNIWFESYGLRDGTAVTLEHIMALLFYTNFSTQCYEFGRTYRKVSEFESERSLKKRHSEVAVWGRLLRELVECYGYRMAPGDPDSEQRDFCVFYHGVSVSMMFNSTSISLCGPVSTSISMLSLLPWSLY